MPTHPLMGVVCWAALGACVDPHHATFPSLHHIAYHDVPAAVATPQVQVTYTDDRGVPIFADAEGRPVYADGSPVDPARIVPRYQPAPAAPSIDIHHEEHHEDHHRHH